MEGSRGAGGGRDDTRGTITFSRAPRAKKAPKKKAAAEPNPAATSSASDEDVEQYDEDFKRAYPGQVMPFEVNARKETKRYRLSDYDRAMYDYCREALSKNVWYYRDRLSVPRGPCNLPVLRECWVNGVIDEHTLVWGQGLDSWLPVRNVRTLVPMIRTVEVQIATWIKRTFALKPALARIRRLRGPERKRESDQVETMY